MRGLERLTVTVWIAAAVMLVVAVTAVPALSGGSPRWIEVYQPRDDVFCVITHSKIMRAQISIPSCVKVDPEP